MAWLFERFVERLTTEIASHLGMRVQPQQPDRGALLDARGDIYRRVRPDLVVSYGGDPIAVVDAKYKDYWPTASRGGVPIKRISNEDVYQLFFYAQRLQYRHGLPKPPKAFVFAPLPAVDERGGYDVIDSQHTEVSWRAGGERAGRLVLVLLPMTEILRAMAGTKDWTTRQGDLVEFFRYAMTMH